MRADSEADVEQARIGRGTFARADEVPSWVRAGESMDVPAQPWDGRALGAGFDPCVGEVDVRAGDVDEQSRCD